MTKAENSPGTETAIDPIVPVQGVPVETEALKALQFYAQNYTNLMFRGLGGNKQIILGSKKTRPCCV